MAPVDPAPAGRFEGAPGVMFADENRDDEWLGNELGHAHVKANIDGRCGGPTDRAGRFEFPFISAGPHDIALRREPIPLRYGPARERLPRIEVPLRGSNQSCDPGWRHASPQH